MKVITRIMAIDGPLVVDRDTLDRRDIVKHPADEIMYNNDGYLYHVFQGSVKQKERSRQGILRATVE
jgi:hypothetical protein